MRANKQAERSMAKLAEMLTNFGMDKAQVEEIKDSAPTTVQAVSYQGDAVLRFLEKPAAFTTKVCKREACDMTFATNYRNVAYCSDNCRARELERQLGVKWNWLKPEHERWGGDPPLIIPPAALQMLDTYIKWFASQPQIQSQKENPQIEASPVLPETLEPDYLPLSMSPPVDKTSAYIPEAEPLVQYASSTQDQQHEEDPFGFD